MGPDMRATLVRRSEAGGAGRLKIRVLPAPVGWRVECAGGFEPLLFLSGAQAERHSRALARRLAALGRDVIVEIYDRCAALVAAICCYGEGGEAVLSA